MDSRPCLAAAIRFIDVFPKAAAFNVLLRTDERRVVYNKPQMGRQALLTELPRLLEFKEVHFFIRPLLANVAMIDLDNFQGEISSLLALKPRALTSTSPGNFQAWFTIPDSMASKTSIEVAKQLTHALQADNRSAKTDQDGRLPGSLNVKLGKGNCVDLLHTDRQFMCEKTYLETTASTRIKLQDGAICLEPQPRKSAVICQEKVDMSNRDFAMCCQYFEADPNASIEQAAKELKGKFVADRKGYQRNYENLTIANAHARVASRQKQPRSSKEPDQQASRQQQEAVQESSRQDEQPNQDQNTNLTAADVQLLINKALRVQFPPKQNTAKSCSECEKTFDKKGFTGAMWDEVDEARICLECDPVNENLRKRYKENKPCSQCKVEKGIDAFSRKMWDLGKKRRCTMCITAGQIQQRVHNTKDTRYCSGCEKNLPFADFTKTQLDRPHTKVPVYCRTCAQNNQKSSWNDTKERNAAKRKAEGEGGGGGEEGDKDEWPEKTRSAAMRFIMESPEENLPSTHAKSLQAVRALRHKAD